MQPVFVLSLAGHQRVKYLCEMSLNIWVSE
jgi:hypothetical protein